MDMEVSPNNRQIHHEEECLKLDRLSALLTLASDSNSSVSASAIDELCKLDSGSIHLIATDLLSLTETGLHQSSRERLFRLLTPYHQTLPSLTTVLVLELLGDERQQNIALELLPSLQSSSLGALPILIYLAEMFPNSESARSNLFLECARNISHFTDQFISVFAPELPYQIRSHVELPTELQICGRLLFTEDHDVFSPSMSELVESNYLNEVALAPSSIFLLLGGNLKRMSVTTQIAAVKIASLAPTITRHFGERVSCTIREKSPAIVRQCGLYMVMKIAPHQFPNFSDDFEVLLSSDNNYATICASLIVHSISDTLSTEHQIFLIDSLLRACKGADIERYNNILFCMQGLDAEQILPHLFKLYLNAPSTEHERATRMTIQSIKDLLPSSRRPFVLGRIKNELGAELPSFRGFINTILG